MHERDAAIEKWLEDLNREVEYFVVQDGDSLLRLSEDGEGIGVHYTRASEQTLLKHGLGAHPRFIEAHEWPSWTASRLGWTAAYRVAKAYLTGSGNPERIVEKALAEDVSLRCLWFAAAVDYVGATATGSHRVEFSLFDVGEWVAATGGHVTCFTDNAGGWCLAWDGPQTIPPALFTYIR